MKRTHLIVAVMLVVIVGCAGKTLDALKNPRLQMVLELARVATYLFSADSVEGMKGFAELEETYKVELTDPLEQFIAAAKTMTLALKELRQAMFPPEIVIAQEDHELLRVKAELDALIEKYEQQ